MSLKQPSLMLVLPDFLYFTKGLVLLYQLWNPDLHSQPIEVSVEESHSWGYIC